MLQPLRRYELWQNHSDHLIFVLFHAPVNITDQWTHQGAVRGRNYHQLDPFYPFAPLRAQFLRRFVIEVDVNGRHMFGSDWVEGVELVVIASPYRSLVGPL